MTSFRTEHEVPRKHLYLNGNPIERACLITKHCLAFVVSETQSLRKQEVSALVTAQMTQPSISSQTSHLFEGHLELADVGTDLTILSSRSDQKTSSRSRNSTLYSCEPGELQLCLLTSEPPVTER